MNGNGPAKKLVKVVVEEIEAIIIREGKAAVVLNPPSLTFTGKNTLLIDPAVQSLSPRSQILFAE